MIKKTNNVINLKVSDLEPFPNHPFSVNDDALMKDMVESIKQHGILTPVIARLNEENKYEIISGHRRVHACKSAGIDTVPVVLKECSREEAIVMMVDSNLQREHIPPCEKGLAYRMKKEALYHSGKSFGQHGERLENSLTQIANESNDSERTIQRYIRLTELNPELQKCVNESKIGITPAVELSYLTPKEQNWIVETIDSEQCVPSLSQAQKMRKLSSDGLLTEDIVLDIMSQLKKPEHQK